MKHTIKLADCFCSKTNRRYKLQFVNDADKDYVLEGSYCPTVSSGEEEKPELNGKFSIGSNYKKAGCPFCGNKAVAVCINCHTFFCYSGDRTENMLCPSCKKTVTVPTMLNNVITYTEKSTALYDENAMVLLVIDFSGSMREDEKGNETSDVTKTKFTKMQETLLSEVVGSKLVKAMLGLVYFNNEVEYKVPITSKRNKIEKELTDKSLKPKYNNAANPIKTILTSDEFKSFREAKCPKLILLYTDGHFNRPQGMATQAKKLQDDFNIEIIALGSPDADEKLLSSISTSGVTKLIDYKSLKKVIGEIVAKGGFDGQ